MSDKLKKTVINAFNTVKKNQRFMLSVAVFPFIILFNWIGQTIFKTDLKAATPSITNQINAELQDPDLEKSQTKNKFDALFDAYDKKEDFSAIQDLEGLGSGNEKSMELDDKNLYSMSEMDMISRGNGSRLTGNNQSQAESNYSLFKNAASNSPSNSLNSSNGLGYSPKFALQGIKGSQPSRVDNTEINRGYANYESHLNSMNNANGANNRNYERETPKEFKESKQSNPHEDNMALFRAQMAVIDSMTNKRKEKRNDKSQMNQIEKGELSEALNGSNESDNAKPFVKSTAKSALNTEKIIEVSKTENDNSRFFNTVGLSKNNSFIKAILDEGLKVYDGSRVRIRLMDDIQFEGRTLEKGTYLYGIISGFKTQRVLLTITNIAYNNEILNVKLDVFDQDGMKGLYIPESLFREIAKEASAQTVGGQNLQFSDNNALNATQMAYTAAQDIYKTTTRAMSDAIRKRKAVLKYNTQIFLVNSK
jgi:conjugative transposon TraM protein